MVSTGGFGGGPGLPMAGDAGLMTAVIVLLIIVVIIFLVTRVFEV
jgi:hypothetical protein